MAKTFEEMALEGLNKVQSDQAEIKSKQATILDDVGRWSKETKSAMEELTTVKNTLGEYNKTLGAIQKLQAKLALESRLAFGNPIERLCADPEKRNWLNAVVRSIVFPGMKLPEHLQKSLSGVDSGLGQAVVPAETAADIYDTLASYGSWKTLGVRRVGARSTSLAVKTARAAGYWIGSGTGGTVEGSAITEGSYTGGAVTLSIQTLGVYLTVTREEIQDAVADVSQQVVQDFAEQAAYMLDWMAFTADGTADQTDAGYKGIFEMGGVNTNAKASAAAGNTTIAKLDYDDVARCLLTVNPSVLSRAAKWWMHPYVLVKLAGIKDSTGRPLFQTAMEAPSPGSIGSILGYPVELVQAAPSTDAASAKVAVFGDPQGQVVGIRQDFEFATSEHVKFAEGLIAFRGTMRAGTIARVTSGNPAACVPMAVLTLAAQ